MKNNCPDIAIIAPGLLGASIGAASRKKGICGKIHVWARREETRQDCSKLDWCDEVHEQIGDAVQGADLVWVCAPVSSIANLIYQFSPFLKEGAIVSDVGSTKGQLTKNCEQAIGKNGIFVGSHPMAGSEKSGLEFATDNLYEGRPCFITPSEHTPPTATEAIEQYWQSLGMHTQRVSPDEHDKIVAYISHLPHLMASSLAHLLFEKGESHWKQFVGTGLLDTTRIASGSVNMWKDIVAQNRAEILPTISDMIESLEHLKAHIESGHPDALIETLNKGKIFRDSIEPE